MLAEIKMFKQILSLTFTFQLYLVFIIYQVQVTQSVLYPYESESRETKSLNGIWNFLRIPNNQILEFPYSNRMDTENDAIKMPVPSSYNDITTDPKIRDHVGWVLYWREFYLMIRWVGRSERVFVHFGGVHHNCVLFINKQVSGIHEGGHIPFIIEITDRVVFGLNTIEVLVNNTLTNYTLPQGFVEHHNPNWHPTGFTTYHHNCDYFDYAGINRPVTLYTTPKNNYIKDITVETSQDKLTTGYVVYNVTIEEKIDSICQVMLLDKHENAVASLNQCSGLLKVKNVTLWYPHSFGIGKGPYLYSLVVQSDKDIYRLPVGIRTINFTKDSFLLNDQPIYFRGFGMHEDADIRGRGFDNAILIRDMNLLKWTNANLIRTSHYPYSDEFLNEADSQGILVILEVPSCSLDQFSYEHLLSHKTVLSSIVGHHVNRPSVIMWSLANEPLTNQNNSGLYFSELVNLTKLLDPTRPVTFVTSQLPENDKAVMFMDIICINRYNGWYSYPGNVDVVKYAISDEIQRWHQKFSKPVIVTEYGADSYVGQRKLPASMWSEDYQVHILQEHFTAFDAFLLTDNDTYLIGELIWNFIDFNVPQEYFRPGNCDKGIFTRDRQPKSAAYVVKQRYETLQNRHLFKKTSIISLSPVTNEFPTKSVSLVTNESFTFSLSPVTNESPTNSLSSVSNDRISCNCGSYSSDHCKRMCQSIFVNALP